MKNVITIDTTKNCDCQCVVSVDDKTNSIVVSFTVGDVENAKALVLVDGIEKATFSLDANTDNTVVLPDKYFTTATMIEVGYSDSTRVCDNFTFTFSGERKGEMLVCQTDNFNYTVNFKVAGSGGAYTLPPATTTTLGGVIVGNGLNVDGNGLLSVDDYFFDCVRNGKEEIAAAITNKGVETAADATFLQMANNINNISSGSVLSGLTTYESRCPSINEYVIPSGGYAYMVAQGFAELAELLGLRWDAPSNTMYAGDNVDYGFRFMQTGQTSFGIMTKKVPQASDAANYVVTGIDVGHSIIYARCKDGVVFGHYKNGSDNHKYNLHWVVTKYKNLNDGSQKYAYFYPSINTADSTIITEDGEQIAVLMHSRYNTNSGASTSYIQMYQICTEQGYLLNNAYVTSNYPTDNYDDKEYAYEFEMNGKKYIQIQFVMNSSFESYCIELE